MTLIASICLVNCSSDDDGEIATDNVKLFKKLDRYHGGLFYDKTINYNSDKRIESMVINKYEGGGAPYYNAITVSYSGSTVATITAMIHSEDPNSINHEITYAVSFNNNVITLTSDELEIEIIHSNGYVDSITKYYTDDTSQVLNASYLSRDSNQNLISIVFNGETVVNSYSDHDSDKKPDQDGIIIDVLHRDYFYLLGLKLTANNPRTYSQSILGSPGPDRTHTYEYDDEGYIIKTIAPNSVSYADTFYIEQ